MMDEEIWNRRSPLWPKLLFPIHACCTIVCTYQENTTKQNKFDRMNNNNKKNLIPIHYQFADCLDLEVAGTQQELLPPLTWT